MRLLLSLAVLTLIFATAVPAWQQEPQQNSESSAAERDRSALTAAMEEMHAAMASVPTSSDPDLDFVRLMLPHHQAAIDMAKAQLLYGRDPQMRRLAQEILADQQSEIDLMQLWLKQRPSVSGK